MARKATDFFPESDVAVTGVGMITPLGISAPECWENMLLGRSGIRPITKFDVSECPVKIGGQLPESYDLLEKSMIHKRTFKQTVTSTRIAMICASEAIKDSRLEINAVDSRRCAVIFGTTGSSVRTLAEHVDGPDKFKIIREMFNAAAARISMDFGFKGYSFTISAGSESGTCAIAKAYDLIRHNMADVVIACGADTLLTANFLRRLKAFQCLCRNTPDPGHAIKPFDKNRSGFAVSDGGCAVVLESIRSANQRNADIYAIMSGYGNISQFSVHQPDTAMTRSMELAVNQSGISKEKIGYINANGTGTTTNDLSETRAIKTVFGNQAHDLLISAHKSMIGHTFSASGVIGFAVAAKSLKSGMIPPTINYETPDPLCDLNYVPNEMIGSDNGAAIVNSFGLTGHYFSLVLKSSEH